jgi:5-formyltetrahydrofolate cyclo-ligase
MPVNDLRTRLRRQFRSARRDVADRAARERDLNLHVLRVLSDIPTSAVIATYAAMPGEVELDGVYARRPDQEWALPVIDPERQGEMAFFTWHAGENLETREFGIRTPGTRAAPVSNDRIALCLIPLVAFDDQGSRLGMGGGYYDRFLARLRVDVPRIGIGFDCQRCAEPLPRESWDIALTAAITESGMIEFDSTSAD